MRIMKFGGTSVGSVERMHALVDLVHDDTPKIVVLSAMSGTTNALVEIAAAAAAGGAAKAGALIDALEEKYVQVAGGLYKKPEAAAKGRALIEERFALLRRTAAGKFGHAEERLVLAQGELLSTALFHYYLGELGVDSVLLPALDFMRIDANGDPDMWYIETSAARELAKYPGRKLFITQGYICRNAAGAVDNLKRGGSDYTATILGAAVRADEIQIWTDIDGMHNNDPRVVKNTHPIAELSFDEAAELAYFGAKILHPTCILPARERNVPVRLLNTMCPEAPGTLITGASTGEPIKAVAAKDGITAIKIKSDRMLLAYGFLRSVFDVFERCRTPIDMITTSEVAVSLTIDDKSNLKDIVPALEKLGAVEVDEDLTIICVVGSLGADKEGYARRIFESLKNVPIRMISYGGSEHNVSVLVRTAHKQEALLALNEGLF